MKSYYKLGNIRIIGGGYSRIVECSYKSRRNRRIFGNAITIFIKIVMRLGDVIIILVGFVYTNIP